MTGPLNDRPFKPMDLGLPDFETNPFGFGILLGRVGKVFWGLVP